jgi:hypothetical protein
MAAARESIIKRIFERHFYKNPPALAGGFFFDYLNLPAAISQKSGKARSANKEPMG